MGKHDFKWATEEEIRKLSYEPPKDDFYKARIATLERENAALRDQMEKRSEFYGMGKQSFEKLYKEVSEENDRLRDRVARLEIALVNSEIRDVQV